MKLLVVLALVGVVAAAPQGGQQRVNSNQDVQILRYDTDSDGLGTYNFNYELSDGSKRQEQSELKNAGTDDEFITLRGSYSWVGLDGVTYVVNYFADETGFHPTIEQGPGGGVPPAVVASLLG